MTDTDIKELRKQCIASLYLCTDNICKYLDDEKKAEFDKLKTLVGEYCYQEAQQEVAIQALEKAKRETDSDVDSLESRFKENLTSLAGKRADVNKHPFMIEINKRYQQAQQVARQNLDESDLAITETQDRYIDPITKKPIEDPVKNTVCGHIYERDSIMNLINRNNRTKCPVAGCGNKGPIKKQHLLSDEELKFRMTITQHSTMIQERSVMNLDDSME
ncbi:E3 SUMO-protein ligase NSE2 [Amyelois transitella]|uniref:E3 SUMO-protein ligase NSE2 n=1 Tax=Amyelois transitella TaxID=680683 RepID=UPI00298F692C|nr:E3 SUMO-protein ligase NSE2 [Amyelois transitella]XP_060801040.1 E3 SUMO-protein ligase NSE2 [Amyelois transitella]XP_060801041.1 E3 SUMO-protein ligase NSE2 [Amyelois transitella]